MATKDLSKRSYQFIDLTGKRFGKWIVIDEAIGYKRRVIHWNCICDCGFKSTINSAHLRSNKTLGCKTCVPTSHGKSCSPEYRVFHDMHNRCKNQSIAAYKDYGGRGITVCEEWESFEVFYRDMGPRPSPKHSIDRRDNSLGYSKGNCRWATKQEQARNTRKTHLLTFNNESRCITDWAKQFGISPNTIRNRLSIGWTPDAAITTPIANTPNHITFNGTTMNLSQWARQIGISNAALRWRLNRWPTAKALAH